MTYLSLREAAKAFKVSRPTLTKALNSGIISGVRNGKGKWEIDPAELARVYQPRQADVATSDESEPAAQGQPSEHAIAEIERLKASLALAEARADSAEKLAHERSARIEDLRRMLPSPQEKDQLVKRRRWWPWRG